jgi:MYXO-CTERM domain-containing protein
MVGGSLRFGRARALFLVLATLFASLLLSTTASARGSVKLTTKRVKEDKGIWKLKVTLDYGGTPHMGHIPMVFSFKQKTLYERYVDDTTGDDPATRRVPRQNATPIDLPMDVGFADMSGKIFKITKFKMKLSREHDFEAGEYTLKVRLASGAAVGRPITVTLNGNNKVINRKAIEFKAPEPKKGKSNDKPDQDTPEPRSGAAEDMGPDLSDIPDISDAEAEEMENKGPDGVEPKQGGCGCETVGTAPSAPRAAWPLLMLGLVATIARRRRR